MFKTRLARPPADGGTAALVSSLGHSDFEFVSDFVIRISNFYDARDGLLS
jgi:hypothetical protein